jgi:hypothetical protein
MGERGPGRGPTGGTARRAAARGPWPSAPLGWRARRMVGTVTLSLRKPTPRRRPRRWLPCDGAVSQRLPTWQWIRQRQQQLHRVQVYSCRLRGERRASQGRHARAGRGPDSWKRQAAGPRRGPGRGRGGRPRGARPRRRARKREGMGMGKRIGRGSGRPAESGGAGRGCPLGFGRRGAGGVRKWGRGSVGLHYTTLTGTASSLLSVGSWMSRARARALDSSLPAQDPSRRTLPKCTVPCQNKLVRIFKSILGIFYI